MGSAEMDKKYIAGIFDGEGWVRISRQKHPKYNHIRYQLYTGVNMVCPDVVSALHKQFGGTFSISPRRKNTHRTLFVWVTSGHGSVRFLKTILPYLRIKKVEAELGIQFMEKKGLRGEADWEFRESCYRIMRSLKHVIYDPVPYEKQAKSGKIQSGQPRTKQGQLALGVRNESGPAPKGK